MSQAACMLRCGQNELTIEEQDNHGHRSVVLEDAEAYWENLKIRRHLPTLQNTTATFTAFG